MRPQGEVLDAFRYETECVCECHPVMVGQGATWSVVTESQDRFLCTDCLLTLLCSGEPMSVVMLSARP